MRKHSHAPSAGVLLAGLLVSAAAMADDRQELLSAFGKAFDRDAYRIEVESPAAGVGRAEVDVQMPDRFHMRSAQGEFIIHPEGSWARQGGQWMRLPMDMSSMVAGYAQPSRDEAEAKITDVIRAGSETVRGCASTLYRYTAEGDTAVAAICNSTGLPVRVQTEGREPVTLYYDFDTRIDIRPPG